MSASPGRQRPSSCDFSFPAEARSRAYFEDIIAEDYADAGNRTRKDLLRLVTGYYLRNQSVHLLVRVEEVRVSSAADRATAVVFVATAGSHLSGFEQILDLRGDLNRLELEFRLDPEPRLIGATWRRARLEELL